MIIVKNNVPKARHVKGDTHNLAQLFIKNRLEQTSTTLSYTDGDKRLKKENQVLHHKALKNKIQKRHFKQTRR